MQFITTESIRTHGLHFDPGDDVLLGMEQAVKELGINNAVILTGFGSTTTYHYHVVADSNLPPKSAFPRGVEPLDVLDLTGMILGGRVHAHISFCGEGAAFGGHLEEGCLALTFVNVWLAELPDIDVADWDQWQRARWGAHE